MHYIVRFQHQGHSGWTHLEAGGDNPPLSHSIVGLLEISGEGETAELAWADHYQKLGMLNPEPAQATGDVSE